MSSQSKLNSFESQFSLKRMFDSLDKFQDVVVFCCGILLVFEMMLVLIDMFRGLNAGIDIRSITADSLFLLILVELFRLLAIYLKYHRIFVGAAVEVTIVSVLREIIVEGLIHMKAPLVFATCIFLFVLGGLMLISHQVEGTIEH